MDYQVSNNQNNLPNPPVTNPVNPLPPNNINSGPVGQLPEKRGIPMLWAAVILIVVALIAVGGVFAYQYFATQQTPVVEPLVQDSNSTADWKTYTNTEYGFEIKYPKNYALDYANSKEIAFYDTEDNSVKNDVFTIVIDDKSVEISDQPYKIKDNNIFHFLGFDNQIKNEMISTFKFANASDILPTVVGQCSQTKVEKVETRIMDCGGGATYNTNCKPIAGSGSAIVYTNGGRQVSYAEVQGIENSRPGDQINLCLISLPTNCPPGDNRGKFYGATNLRTGEKWELSDSQHMCGGA